MCNKSFFQALTFFISLALIPTAILLFSGCASNPGAGAKPAVSATSAPGGAELWAETCAQCHNLRDPSIYSDTQWRTAVAHMRLQANLTGQQEREILTFLQASN